jgi:putative hydrolase of the HAD superfamily
MTFLFDIGRVLLDFSFEPSLARLFHNDISDYSERMEKMLERKDDFEAGRIPADEYVAWAIGVIGSKVTPEEFNEAWRQIFTPNEPMWDCVRKLAADGHRLILFSNTNGIHCPWMFGEYPQFSVFKEAVLSFETGFVKPEPEIYQWAIEKHQLIPEEIFYIDDLPQNIATGIEFGFTCHQYDLKDHAAFESWLAKNLKSQI